jgi:hypothetical protein
MGTSHMYNPYYPRRNTWMLQMAKVSIRDLVICKLIFFLAFLIIFQWSHIYVCKNQCWRDWGFLEGLSRLGLKFFLKWMTHLRNIFKD